MLKAEAKQSGLKDLKIDFEALNDLSQYSGPEFAGFC